MSSEFNVEWRLEEREEDTGLVEEEVNFGFFSTGRELESYNDNHRYTKKEKEILRSYETLDYWPSNSKVYREWLNDVKSKTFLNIDRWIVMGGIGLVVGIIGFFLHQCINSLSKFKWTFIERFFEERDGGLAFLFAIGFGLLLAMMSSLFVVLISPNAAGSGMPELIGFLNGTKLRKIFSFQTLIAKFLSCILAVSSGLPVGPEGPMIHIGSMVGAGVSQFRSKTFGIDLPYFSLLRNSEDRRNFISAGAAAGVSSAFGAPVGGLLFAMEEVSSYWSVELSWQIFFCCMVSAFTTDCLNSAFDGFTYNGNFGKFQTKFYILFKVDHGIDVNILALIPCLILGTIGGILGSVFNFINLKIVRLRSLLLNSKFFEGKPLRSTAVKIFEPILIIFLFSLFIIWLPSVFDCHPLNCTYEEGHSSSFCKPRYNDTPGRGLDSNLQPYYCPLTKTKLGNNTWIVNGSYNEAATLFFSGGEDSIRLLFSRDTHFQFSALPLILFLIFYFFFACWTAGSYISSGIVVPMLLIGGLYGRIFGKLLVNQWDVQVNNYFDWMDPGAMALLGAVSFFGGVSRLTVSLTIIMVEMTNDIQFLLLIMVTVMVAKWVGDMITHPLYHALLEVKCIPFLFSEPRLFYPKTKKKSFGFFRQMVNLDTYTIGEVMISPVVTLESVVTISELVEFIRLNTYGGYPVCKEGIFVGMISRNEIIALLLWYRSNLTIFKGEDKIVIPNVKYEELNNRIGEHITELSKLQEIKDERSRKIDLNNYINTSAFKVDKHFSMRRAYIIFRTMGLRYLIIVDENNAVSGIITRIDLMGFSLEDKLMPSIAEDLSKRTDNVAHNLNEFENPNYAF